MDLANKWSLNLIKFKNIEDERSFCHKLLSKINSKLKLNNNWSSKLGEELVKEILVVKYKQILLNNYDKSSKLKPDFITDKFIIEVKTRNFSTTGSAGEKIIFPAYKYIDLVYKLKKPLIIVLVAKQEIESVNKFDITGNKSVNKLKIINFFKSINTHFVLYSDLLNGIFDLNSIKFSDN